MRLVSGKGSQRVLPRAVHWFLPLWHYSSCCPQYAPLYAKTISRGKPIWLGNSHTFSQNCVTGDCTSCMWYNVRLVVYDLFMATSRWLQVFYGYKYPSDGHPGEESGLLVHCLYVSSRHHTMLISEGRCRRSGCVCLVPREQLSRTREGPRAQCVKSSPPMFCPKDAVLKAFAEPKT